jgi:1,4-dihydroxy-2-naphthoate octaprenyltransferase
MSTMTPCTPTTPARAWLESLRPKTLPLAFASIVMGSAIASLQGVFHPLIALLALLTAGCLQILSNLANMQKGMITAAQMKRAIILTIALTLVCGIALIAVACHKPSDVVGFVILGLLSIGAAITYTVGTRPYGYMGLGDISVLIFFGWISVAGTFYLQAGYFDWIVMLPATATGLLSTAVLNINNLRDIETDRANGKNTLAVRLGPVNARNYHTFILAAATLCLAIFSAVYLRHWTGWLFILAVPMLVTHVIRVRKSKTSLEVRPLLEHMVKTALLTNVLFAVGLLLN